MTFLRVNRLIYVLIGVALAVGLLVAHYSGNKNFKPSTSIRKTLLVLRH